MADYTQPDVVNKRVRFFDGQFLQDQDFIDEQKYHLDRERRQSQLLNVTGIVSGLMVIKGGAYQVTVAKGVAVDALGRQLVLATETNLRLSDKFAKNQDIELRLVYRETPSDLAQSGGEGARRWDESPKIVALAPDGTVAVAPDGASSTWDGPTVLLAKLAVAENGDVTVDATAAQKAGLSVPGAVGIGTTSPPTAKLEVSGGGGTSVDLLVNGRLRSNNNDGGLWIAQDRFVGGHATNQIGFFNGGAWRLTVQPSGHVGIGTTEPENAEGWNKVVDILGAGAAKLSVRTGNVDARVMAHDKGFFGSSAGMIVGTKTNHALSFATNGTTRLSIDTAGKVGIGTINPFWKLSVSSSKEHLALYRENTEAEGGAHIFLELAQIDTPIPRVPVVFPSIRFNHHNRFAHRIEGQASGFHFKTGDPAKNDYSDITVRNITTTGKLEFTDITARNIAASGKLEVAGGGGLNIDLVVNGRLRSNNNDGGLWVAEDRFVGGHSTNQIGFFNNKAWRLTVQPNGNVGIGAIAPEYKLAVSASDNHLVLRRESTEKTGGTRLFLELFQNDLGVAEVFPNIRFHHSKRFWHRIEARGTGFHFKDGGLTSDEYKDITARNIYATGKLAYFWGPDKRWKVIEHKANNFAGSYDTDGPSDGRLKTALRPINNALDKISRLDGIGFRWNDSGLEYLTRDVAGSISAGPDATEEENQIIGEGERRKAVDSLSGEYIGLIAQDVEAVVPEVVHEGADGYKHIRYAHLTALLIEAVKEQQTAIEQLRARFVTLERATA